MTAEACQKLRVFEMGCLGQILGVTRRDRVRNLDIKKQLNIEWDIVNRTQTRRLHYFAHVDYLYARLHSTRPTGRPKLFWVDNIAATSALP